MTVDSVTTLFGYVARTYRLVNDRPPGIVPRSPSPTTLQGDMSDATFITTLDPPGTGVRLAVKDLIDVEGVPTTAGCRAVADRAVAADADAPCLAGARAAGARIVGKTNLHELAFGATGVNQWYGTPTNPLDPALVPGGSSSGSAVAVATGAADVAYGTDTGGSVRVPSACCGTTGLKTTSGRIPTVGVWPLSPSFDTVGPMARDIAGLVTGMSLLEPDFTVERWSPSVVGRLRPLADLTIDAAIDAALLTAGWQVVDISLPEWDTEGWGASLILLAEAWESDRMLLATPQSIGPGPAERLLAGKNISPESITTAHRTVERWRATMARVFEQVEMVALPTLCTAPLETDDDGDDTVLVTATLPVNVAGVPAVSLPVPTPGARVPASLQLVGPWGAEERLLAAAATVEAAAGPGPFGG
jgi:amidase